MMFRHLLANRNHLADAPGKAWRAVLLGSCCHDQPARLHARQSLRKTQLVLSPMASQKQKRLVITLAFSHGHHVEASLCERQVIWAEILHRSDLAGAFLRHLEPRGSAQHQHALPLARRVQNAPLEWKQQGGQSFIHVRFSTEGLTGPRLYWKVDQRKRARTAAPFSIWFERRISPE